MYPSGAILVPPNIPLKTVAPAPGYSYNVNWWSNGSSDAYGKIQAAIDYVNAQNGGTVYLPAGTYNVSQSPTIASAKGVNIIGEGPDHTIINAGNFPALTSVGWWRSLIQGVQFACSANTIGGAIQIDGRTDGQFGVQGLHFDNCIFNGNGNSKYCATLCLIAGGAGQGSENLWTDCDWFGTSGASGSAAFLIGGSNALQNTIVGGDFQGYITGLKIGAGNCNLYSVGFQSTYGLQQIISDGYDVDCSTYSAGDTLIMDGCRTESFQHYKAGGNRVHIRATGQQLGVGTWYPNAFYAPTALICAVDTNGDLKMFYTIAGGTSGATVAFNPTGNTVDGTITWTQTNFTIVDLSGNPKNECSNSEFTLGQVKGGGNFRNTTFTRADAIAASALVGGGGPSMENCYVGGTNGNTAPTFTGNPIKFGNNLNTRAQYPSQFYYGRDFRFGPALWRSADNVGDAFYDVGFYREYNVGSTTVRAQNSIKVFNGLQLDNFTFAELNGINPGGPVMVYCTDGTAGDPLTGGGNGCWAYYYPGGAARWVGK